MASESPPVLFSARPPANLGLARASQAPEANALITQVVHGLAATLDDPESLPYLSELLGRQLGADACLLLSYHPATEIITYTYWHHQVPPAVWLLQAESPSSQADVQRQLALGLIHRVTSPDGDSNRSGSVESTLMDGISGLLQPNNQSLDWLAPIKSFQAIAIDAPADTQGCVLLLSQRHRFNHRLDPAVKAHVASAVAIALHQHHLQHQAQRHAEQRLYLNSLKEDFLSTLNHELRTPLTSMMLAIRMLRRPDLTPERAAMYLDILEQQCSQEINLVNDLLLLQTVDTKPPQPLLTTINLSQLLASVAAQDQGQFATAQLALRLDLPTHPVTLTTAVAPLTRVLQELLTNARKYASPQSTVTLTLNRLADQSVAIHLSNLGAEIQPNELPHIFDKFRRGHKATQNGIPGMGAGLALVKGLVKQIGGTITVASHPTPEGLWQTCFTLGLPTHRENS
ncbi:HAMP domain-containing sensor histidine kinase [Nodosilinea sp. P-1105]|uniref:sensor histidine kinase n=1 Tax=Nodosilinea sp. P-1105 TaxID=2546229 RepID=UPI00146C5C21|nr:HAMP domain-containing sensor histidine kinase [Nodosilinea sp. P-1105]NMF83474.1 HAMP domain-containing histidine kinase [Nodosilinea sp. P-1105]